MSLSTASLSKGCADSGGDDDSQSGDSSECRNSEEAKSGCRCGERCHPAFGGEQSCSDHPAENMCVFHTYMQACGGRAGARVNDRLRCAISTLLDDETVQLARLTAQHRARVNRAQSSHLNGNWEEQPVSPAACAVAMSDSNNTLAVLALLYDIAPFATCTTAEMSKRDARAFALFFDYATAHAAAVEGMWENSIPALCQLAHLRSAHEGTPAVTDTCLGAQLTKWCLASQRSAASSVDVLLNVAQANARMVECYMSLRQCELFFNALITGANSSTDAHSTNTHGALIAQVIGAVAAGESVCVSQGAENNNRDEACCAQNQSSGLATVACPADAVWGVDDSADVSVFCVYVMTVFLEAHAKSMGGTELGQLVWRRFDKLAHRVRMGREEDVIFAVHCVEKLCLVVVDMAHSQFEMLPTLNQLFGLLAFLVARLSDLPSLERLVSFVSRLTDMHCQTICQGWNGVIRVLTRCVVVAGKRVPFLLKTCIDVLAHITRRHFRALCASPKMCAVHALSRAWMEVAYCFARASPEIRAEQAVNGTCCNMGQRAVWYLRLILSLLYCADGHYFLETDWFVDTACSARSSSMLLSNSTNHGNNSIINNNSTGTSRSLGIVPAKLGECSPTKSFSDREADAAEADAVDYGAVKNANLKYMEPSVTSTVAITSTTSYDYNSTSLPSMNECEGKTAVCQVISELHSQPVWIVATRARTERKSDAQHGWRCSANHATAAHMTSPAIIQDVHGSESRENELDTDDESKDMDEDDMSSDMNDVDHVDEANEAESDSKNKRAEMQCCVCQRVPTSTWLSCFHSLASMTLVSHEPSISRTAIRLIVESAQTMRGHFDCGSEWQILFAHSYIAPIEAIADRISDEDDDDQGCDDSNMIDAHHSPVEGFRWVQKGEHANNSGYQIFLGRSLPRHLEYFASSTVSIVTSALRHRVPGSCEDALQLMRFLLHTLLSSPRRIVVLCGLKNVYSLVDSIMDLLQTEMPIGVNYECVSRVQLLRLCRAAFEEIASAIRCHIDHVRRITDEPHMGMERNLLSAHVRLSVEISMQLTSTLRSAIFQIYPSSHSATLQTLLVVYDIVITITFGSLSSRKAPLAADSTSREMAWLRSSIAQIQSNVESVFMDLDIQVSTDAALDEDSTLHETTLTTLNDTDAYFAYVIKRYSDFCTQQSMIATDISEDGLQLMRATVVTILQRFLRAPQSVMHHRMSKNMPLLCALIKCADAELASTLSSLFLRFWDRIASETHTTSL